MVSKRTSWMLAGFCTAIAMGLFFLENAPLLKPVKTALQGASVPVALLDYGKMGQILRHNSLVIPKPNDFSRYPFNADKDNLIQKTKNALDYKLRHSPDEGTTKSTFIRIEFKTAQKSRARIFWAKNNEPFSNARSEVFDVVKQRFLHILIDDLKNVRRLRIDPMEHPGVTILNTLVIYQEGYEPLCYYREKDFRTFRPNNQLSLLPEKDGNGLILESSGTDPFFTYNILPKKKQFSDAVFQKKRRVGQTLYTVNSGGHNSLASTQVLKGQKKDRFPTLSLAVDKTDLYDPKRGIIANYEQRGREWERSGTFSYYDNGRLQYGSKIGVRLHGGRSRNKDYHSFRIYFRKEYGVESLTPGIISEFGLTPIKTLVVHATHWPPGMPHNTLLAYDFVNRMGGIAPHFKLVNLYLNGKKMGLYFITTHQGRRQIRAELGHDDFEMYRFKSKNSLRSQYILNKHVWDSAYGPAPLTRQYVEQKIDIDLFTRHVLSIIFCGTSDNCQGTALVNYKDPDPKMYWMSWDMDHSFVDFAQTIKNRLATPRPVWKQTSWKLVYRDSNFRCGRSQLFSRLMNEDPGYRRYAAGLMLELMNHFINQAFVADRLQFYRSITEAQDEDLTDYYQMLEDFFAHRPDEIRRRMTELFELPAVLPLSVKSSQPFRFHVDGHIKQSSYTGWYFEKDWVALEVPESLVKHFSHWQIEGKTHHTQKIRVQMMEPSEIELAWKES